MKAGAVVADRVPLVRRPALGAVAALFLLTLRQQIRGRRLLGLALLFSLPGLLAAVIPWAARVPPPAGSLEFALLFTLMPCALAPLASLLYAAGIVQDEVEEQTLTYLLLRPIPRWVIYLTRLLAILALTAALTAVFTAITCAVLALSTAGPQPAELGLRAAKTAALLGLAEAGYCALFGLLGLFVRRALLIGVSYIVLCEWLLASFDTLARRLTVMYHFRVLVLRWLQPQTGNDWSINLTTAPQMQTCVLVMLGVAALLAFAAAGIFAAKEFRLKTPEGS
jgi:ABC-2 type transport system permease protein